MAKKKSKRKNRRNGGGSGTDGRNGKTMTSTSAATNPTRGVAESESNDNNRPSADERLSKGSGTDNQSHQYVNSDCDEGIEQMMDEFLDFLGSKSISSRGRDNIGGIGDCRDSGPCWICLEEGVDDSGEHLRRNCSCRGSAGFAHFSCLVKYAKQKSEDIVNKKGSFRVDQFCDSLGLHWEKCPHCKQNYQQDLATDMADQLFEQVESFDHLFSKMKCFMFIEALHLKGRVLTRQGENYGKNIWGELKQNAHRILEYVEQSKAKHLAYPGEFLPFEAKAYDFLASGIWCKWAWTLDANSMIGHTPEMPEGIATYRKKEYRLALAYFEKSRDLFAARGDTDSVKSQNFNIALVKSQLKEKSFAANDCVEKARAIYKHVQSFCKNDKGNTMMLNQAYELSMQLYKALHRIEAERLLSETLSTCTRVHGANHDLAKKGKILLEQYQGREVRLKSREGVFRVVEWSGANEYIVQNVKTPKEMAFAVSADEVIIVPGTIVTCHGLKNASHLNQKLGEIRSVDDETGRCQIHFEEEGLRTCSALQANLRVVVKLPALP